MHTIEMRWFFYSASVAANDVDSLPSFLAGSKMDNIPPLAGLLKECSDIVLATLLIVVASSQP